MFHLLEVVFATAVLGTSTVTYNAVLCAEDCCQTSECQAVTNEEQLAACISTVPTSCQMVVAGTLTIDNLCSNNGIGFDTKDSAEWDIAEFNITAATQTGTGCTWTLTQGPQVAATCAKPTADPVDTEITIASVNPDLNVKPSTEGSLFKISNAPGYNFISGTPTACTLTTAPSAPFSTVIASVAKTVNGGIETSGVAGVLISGAVAALAVTFAL